MEEKVQNLLSEYFDYALEKKVNIKNIELIESLNYIYSEEVVEKQKAINNVIITSVVYKILNPKQDIRYHKTTLSNGYSARSFDTKYIVPFLQSKDLLTMKESGWLTRSIEQNHPFTSSFPGRIRDPLAKEHFLKIIDYIQKNKKSDLENILIFIFSFLIEFKSKNENIVAKLDNVNVHSSNLMDILYSHYKLAKGKGVSRLPVLALYAVLEQFYKEIGSENKNLESLDSHTSSDLRSGGVGDIHITNIEGEIVEAIEVKSGIEIDLIILKNKYSLFKDKPIKKYIFCTTSEINIKDEVLDEIQRIHTEHGCDVMIFNLYQYIFNSLSLIGSLDKILENYLKLVKKDDAVQFHQKKLLQDCIDNILN